MKRWFKIIYKSCIDICKFIILVVLLSLITAILAELIKAFPIIGAVLVICVWLYLLYGIIKYNYDKENEK